MSRYSSLASSPTNRIATASPDSGRSGATTPATSTPPAMALPLQYEGLDVIKPTAVACGGEHSIVLSEKGTVYTFGVHDNGRLGYRVRTRAQTTPKEIVSDKLCVNNVAAGEYHTVLTLTDGRVFAFGCGSQGQLGTGSVNDAWCPQELLPFRDIRSPAVSAACGEFHSLVCLANGDVYSFGSGSAIGLDGSSGLAALPSAKHCEKYGFGMRAARSMLITPTKINFVPHRHMIAVAAGSKHSLFLASTGQVFACGINDDGQLGHDPAASGIKEVGTPIAIPRFDEEHAVQVAAGGHHSAVVTDRGDLYVFGANESGQLGIGCDDRFIPVPTKVSLTSPVRCVGVGAAHTIVVLMDGYALAAGWGNGGRLGLGHSRATKAFSACKLTLEKGDKVVEVGAGSHHTLCRTQRGVVLGFGCGGRGQLGTGDTSDAWVPAMMKPLVIGATQPLASQDTNALGSTGSGAKSSPAPTVEPPHTLEVHRPAKFPTMKEAEEAEAAAAAEAAAENGPATLLTPLTAPAAAARAAAGTREQFDAVQGFDPTQTVVATSLRQQPPS